MRNLKLLVLFVIGGTAVLAIGSMSLGYAGFCYDEGRFLSDDEHYNSAIDHLIRRPRVLVREEVDGKLIKKDYDKVRYEDADEFLRRNPDCCRIVPGGGDDYIPVTFWRRMTGLAYKVVLVEYAERIRDEGRVREVSLRRQITTNQCGDVLRY